MASFRVKQNDDDTLANVNRKTMQETNQDK